MNPLKTNSRNFSEAPVQCFPDFLPTKQYGNFSNLFSFISHWNYAKKFVAKAFATKTP